ncbi:MAG: hypothetical protein ACKOTB_11915, partial [Planctomycetia bacterium]
MERIALFGPIALFGRVWRFSSRRAKPPARGVRSAVVRATVAVSVIALLVAQSHAQSTARDAAAPRPAAPAAPE